MTTRLLTLIIKEFKAIWKDPRSRMIVTIMPIIQLIVFANAVTMEVKNIDMLVLDNSRSYYSRELISHFANSPWFNSVAVVDTPEQLKQSIDIQKASLALEIPPDFAVSIKKQDRRQRAADNRRQADQFRFDHRQLCYTDHPKLCQRIIRQRATLGNSHQKLVQCQP